MSAERVPCIPDGTTWLQRAEARANGWDDATLDQVLDAMPYKPSRAIRPEDWVILVAHVAEAKGERPVDTAARLASFVTEWHARYGAKPSPSALARSQEDQ